MNVLIVPEDFVQDQYILKPIITAMFDHLKKPTKVAVCQNPRLKGVDQALDEGKIREILEQYDWKVDLFLICVDRDGKDGRKTRLTQLEELAAHILRSNHKLLAENAWQEVEVWVLAGHDDLPTEWDWQQVRQERDLKEMYYLPYAEQRGFVGEADQGRKTLAEEAARHYNRIRQLCKEDIVNLEDRIQQWMEE